MCTYDSCLIANQSYESRREWIAHEVSHGSSGDFEPGTAACPFCLKQFTSDQGEFYRHVGHHMEDIRLFSLPPSYRQPGDLDDDHLSNNSSCTEPSEKTLPGERGALASVEEEAPPHMAGRLTNLAKHIRKYNLPDRQSVQNWLTGEGVAILDAGDLGNDDTPLDNDTNPINSRTPLIRYWAFPSIVRRFETH